MRCPLPNIEWSMAIHNDVFCQLGIALSHNIDLLSNLNFSLRHKNSSWDCDGCGRTTGEVNSTKHLASSQFGLADAPLFDASLFKNCSDFLKLEFRHPLVLQHIIIITNDIRKMM